MSSCTACAQSECSLIQVSRLLAWSVLRQAEQYRKGNMEADDSVDTLYQLHTLMRKGACSRTARRPNDYIPQILERLQQLPAEQGVLLAFAIGQTAAQLVPEPESEPERQRRPG